jgi:hypothetical protein
MIKIYIFFLITRKKMRKKIKLYKMKVTVLKNKDSTHLLNEKLKSEKELILSLVISENSKWYNKLI